MNNLNVEEEGEGGEYDDDDIIRPTARIYTITCTLVFRNPWL
jgi:hypothetical protein